MKLVVTILQARRVVLPYVFVRHVLPRMREAFKGTVEAVLIQHRTLPQVADTFLATNRHDDGSQRVMGWTAQGSV